MWHSSLSVIGMMCWCVDLLENKPVSSSNAAQCCVLLGQQQLMHQQRILVAPIPRLPFVIMISVDMNHCRYIGLLFTKMTALQ